MNTKQNLIDALRYDFAKPLYNGDVCEDAAEMLENSVDRYEFITDFKNDYVGDIIAQLPDEDFLEPIIDMVSDIKHGKLLKKDILKRLGTVINALEDLQQMQANSSDYARSIVRDLK